ncbi:hypothetical protein [Pseudoalteromonas luteoviolacea]|uniref:hypothetical protein n=1 Tax=Pseudoalteromonas luteoviolacea TaxID=43657 RepID=UPI000A78D592|nr:hypothetical protein [Pseudoalteromonas luteoviolacea]
MELTTTASSSDRNDDPVFNQRHLHLNTLYQVQLENEERELFSCCMRNAQV